MTVQYAAHDQRVAGSIHFEPHVPEYKILEIMLQLKNTNTTRWVHLHTRSGGDNGSRVLAFVFILPDGEKKTQDKFTYVLLEDLKKSLGTVTRKQKDLPKGVKAWNISPIEAYT